jgi:hypothetical protein
VTFRRTITSNNNNNNTRIATRIAGAIRNSVRITVNENHHNHRQNVSDGAVNNRLPLIGAAARENNHHVEANQCLNQGVAAQQCHRSPGNSSSMFVFEPFSKEEIELGELLTIRADEVSPEKRAITSPVGLPTFATDAHQS